MYRRTAACIMILALLISCAAAGEEMPARSEYDSLTVGNTTQMQGEFFTDGWGNATSDYDVRDLLHGYNLIRWDADLSVFNTDDTVVSGITAGENAEHDRSYVLALQHDLYYSDGTPITAWDYAFSLLLRISPEMAALGASSGDCRYLYGYDEYISGASQSLAGVHVSADDMLTITVRHEYLPFFYELGLLRCNPYPIHVIAPGVTVRDDGNGVYLANEDPEQTEPLFTAELLEKTLNDPETGYRSHPSVVSGPYTLVSWDGTTAQFEINPYYKGNYDGEKPLIQHLTYMQAGNETMLDDLREGRMDLLNKVTNAEAIQQGMGEVGTGAIQMSSYPRLGLSFISFCCEKAAVSGQAVRQAIAWCLDRDLITREYTGNYGIRADGYYGLGQWEYGILNGTTALPVEEPEDPGDKEAMAAYEAELAAWEELSLDGLTPYTADPDTAGELLERDGWKLNDDGIREKEIDGETVRLDLTLVYPAGNRMAELLTDLLIPNLEQVGIRLKLEPAEMPELLAMYYRLAPRENDMFFLATNFDLIYDPSIHFETENGVPTWYYAAYADETLYDLAADMRKTTPGDLLEYCRKWVAFQERINETLPVLPLYTNVYFDFYTTLLHDYAISESVTWAEAVIGASLYDEPAEEDEFE